MHKYLSPRDIAPACPRSKYHPSCVGAFTRIAPATLVMLVQLVDRLGQGFRRNYAKAARASPVLTWYRVGPTPPAGTKRRSGNGPFCCPSGDTGGTIFSPPPLVRRK